MTTKGGKSLKQRILESWAAESLVLCYAKDRGIEDLLINDD